MFKLNVTALLFLVSAIGFYWYSPSESAESGMLRSFTIIAIYLCGFIVSIATLILSMSSKRIGRETALWKRRITALIFVVYLMPFGEFVFSFLHEEFFAQRIRIKYDYEITVPPGLVIDEPRIKIRGELGFSSFLLKQKFVNTNIVLYGDDMAFDNRCVMYVEPNRGLRDQYIFLVEFPKDIEVGDSSERVPTIGENIDRIAYDFVQGKMSPDVREKTSSDLTVKYTITDVERTRGSR